MVKFQVVIRKKRKDRNGLVNVEIMAGCKGVRVHFLTGFKVAGNQFKSGMVVNHAASDQINTAIQMQMAGYIERFIRFNGSQTNMNAAAIREMLTEPVVERLKFETMAKQMVDETMNRGSVKSAQLLQYTLNKISNRSPVVTFDQITPAYLRQLENDLRQSGIKQNTVALLFRYVRLVFNRAIVDGVISQEIYPFRKFKIKSEKTLKRALSVEELRRLRLVESPAVDIFFLSFLLIGVNIKDLLFAKAGQVENGRFYYTRCKTGKPISVLILPQAAALIEKHKGEKLLLNFMEGRKRLDQFNKWINKSLRAAAAVVEINRNVTTYAARHSWATIASGLGVSREVIGHALGHSAATVTDVYIDFDFKRVDRANEIVVRSVFFLP